MRKYPLGYALIILFFLLFGCNSTRDKSALAKEAPEEKISLAPDFQLEDLYGNMFSLASYRDKQPVILFFWTTRCPYCLNELINLKNMHTDLLTSGWELFAIDVQESRRTVENFSKKLGLNFKILLDENATVALSYGVLGVPTYIIIDKKGEVVFKNFYFPQDKFKDQIWQ